MWDMRSGDLHDGGSDLTTSAGPLITYSRLYVSRYPRVDKSTGPNVNLCKTLWDGVRKTHGDIISVTNVIILLDEEGHVLALITQNAIYLAKFVNNAIFSRQCFVHVKIW